MQIHVVCHRPGMHRGGRTNPRHAVYAPGDHTIEQLRDLLEEPEITVIVGELLSDDHIIAFANGGDDHIIAFANGGAALKAKKA